MKRNAADRLNPLHKGTLLVALCAATLLVLAGGCGQFNDNPNQAGMSFTMSFKGADASGTSSTMSWNTSTLGTIPVKSVIVGAIVIRHNNGNCAAGVSVCPYTSVTQVNDTNRDALQNDAEQSVNFLEINPISDGNDTEVEFPIPPNAAGPWQLVGIGLKNDLSAAGIAQVTSLDPIWYGFVGAFLNDSVVPGELYPVPLILEPWCATPNGGPLADGSPPCL